MFGSILASDTYLLTIYRPSNGLWNSFEFHSIERPFGKTVKEFSHADYPPVIISPENDYRPNYYHKTKLFEL